MLEKVMKKSSKKLVSIVLGILILCSLVPAFALSNYQIAKKEMRSVQKTKLKELKEGQKASKKAQREIFKKERIFSERNQSLNAVVFTSMGSLDHKKNFIDPWHDLNQQIDDSNYRGLVYRTTIIENETHLSMFPSALTKGLKFVLNYSKQ